MPPNCSPTPREVAAAARRLAAEKAASKLTTELAKHAERHLSAGATAAARTTKAEQHLNAKAEQLQAKSEQFAAKAEKLAAKADHISAHAAKSAALIDRLAGHLDALDVWTRTKPEGRKPKLTRDDIAQTAVHIADSEGIDAVSMRRIAADLGVGTMTLYYYVRTKDELFTLVFDSLAGEIVVPDDEPLPSNWKDAISVIARRSRDCIQRHPWLLDIADDPPIGPNAVRHFDQSLQAVSGLAGTLPDRLDVIMSVDEFVYGHCLMQRNNFSDDGLQSDDRMLGYVSELVASGEYPALAFLVAEHGMAESWQIVERQARDSTRFERNLRRLLDGIELDVRSPQPHHEP